MKFVSTLKTMIVVFCLSLSIVQASNRQLTTGQQPVTPTQLGGFGRAASESGEPLRLNFGFNVQRGSAQATHTVGLDVAPEVVGGVQNVLGAFGDLFRSAQNGGVQWRQTTSFVSGPQSNPSIRGQDSRRSLLMPANGSFAYRKDDEVKNITQEQIDALNLRPGMEVSIQYCPCEWNGRIIRERSLVIKKLVAVDTWSTEIYPLVEEEALASGVEERSLGEDARLVTKPLENEVVYYYKKGTDSLFYTISKSKVPGPSKGGPSWHLDESGRTFTNNDGRRTHGLNSQSTEEVYKLFTRNELPSDAKIFEGNQFFGDEE